MAKSKSTTSIAEPRDDWQTESDVRTLVDAAKIRADPKRLARAMKKAAEMREALTVATKK